MNDTQVIEYIKNFNEKDKSIGETITPTKYEIISAYCKSANSLCMKPWEVSNAPDIFDKFGITKRDFVKITPEDFYGAMYMGVEEFVPRASFSRESWDIYIKREKYKKSIWDLIKMLSKSQQDKLDTVLRYGNIKTWEEVENVIMAIQCEGKRFVVSVKESKYED